MTKEPERVQLTVITQEIEELDDPPRAVSLDGASAGGGESSDGEGDIEIEHVSDEGSAGGVQGLMPAGNITFDVRRRTLINIYQRTILEEFYRCGMTSASLMLNHLHTAAAEKTGLEVNVVKGGNALMHNGYAYYKVRNGENGRVFWKCVKLDCKARISTVNDFIASCRHEHNHLTEEEENKNWIRNRRRPTAVKSAEKFAEKIAHGSLPPVPTIPNVPSLTSIGLPTSSTLCVDSVSSAGSTSTHTNPAKTLAAHLLPDTKKLCTDSALPHSAQLPPQSQSHHHHHQQPPPPIVSIHHSPLTSTHHIHPSPSPPFLQSLPTQPPTSVITTSSSGSVASGMTTNGIGKDKSLLVKVRVSGSEDEDFLEVELSSLSYSSLLKACSEELEVAPHEITKIRKLPNVWVRKDKDVQRLKEGQELEVIIKSSCSSSSSTATNPTPPPITSLLTVNPFSMTSATNHALSLVSAAASAHHQGGGAHSVSLRTESDTGLLAALTSEGPVSMPELTSMGGASSSSNQVNGMH